jgi:hypothetical protein
LNPQETGYFWSKWGQRLKNDLASILAQQLSSEDRERSYVLIDGSFASRFPQIAEEIGLKERRHHTYPRSFRRADHSPEQSPVSPLVNSITDIAGNALIIDARRERHDLVIDLHGNVALFRDLSPHQ